MDHFKNIMDYNFTADVEKELDSIAKGELYGLICCPIFTHHFIKL